MERNAHYAVVGFVTLLLLIGAGLFAAWMSRFSLDRQYDVYDVVFTEPVRGLSVGGEVHFNGIKVGEVAKLSLGKKDSSNVVARIRLEAGVPIKDDSRAVLEPQGVTGVTYIQISPGSKTSPLLLKSGANDSIPIIKTAPSPLSELLKGGGNVLESAIGVMNRVNRVLSDENIRNFSKTLKNTERMTAMLAEQQAVFDQAERALSEAAEAAREVQLLSVSARGFIENDGTQAAQKMGKAADSLDRASEKVSSLMTKLEDPAMDFATTTLPELRASIVELNQATQNVNRLSEEARSSPQGFLAKGPVKEKKVRP